MVGVLSDKGVGDLVHGGSVVLAFQRAGADFDAHRRLADGVLASEIAFHGWLAEPELCVTLARQSYMTCFRLLNGSWACYEELSTRLPEIIETGRDAWLSYQTKTPHEP